MTPTPTFTIPLLPTTKSRALGSRCFHGLHARCAATAGRLDNLPQPVGM